MRNRVKGVLVLLSLVLAGAVVFALCEKPRVSHAEELNKERITSEEAYHLFQEAARLKEQGHGEEAAELFRKAERVEAEARERRSIEKEPRDGEKSLISEEARDLFEKARRLRQESRLDEAEEVGREAERVEAEARERRQLEKERRPDREALREEIRQIVEKAERLAADGSRDEAEELRARAERLEAKARGLIGERREEPEREREFVGGEVPEHLRGELLEAQRRLRLLSEGYGPKHPERLTAERIVRTIEEQMILEEARIIKERYAHDERELPEEARRLLREAGQIQAEAERRNRIEEIEVAIRDNLEESRRLRELGRVDVAEEHLREVERLERELREPKSREGESRPREGAFAREGVREPVRRDLPFRPDMPVPENMLVEIRELRRDVNGLREELGEIKRLLRKLVER